MECCNIRDKGLNLANLNKTDMVCITDNVYLN